MCCVLGSSRIHFSEIKILLTASHSPKLHHRKRVHEKEGRRNYHRKTIIAAVVLYVVWALEVRLVEVVVVYCSFYVLWKRMRASKKPTFKQSLFCFWNSHDIKSTVCILCKIFPSGNGKRLSLPYLHTYISSCFPERAFLVYMMLSKFVCVWLLCILVLFSDYSKNFVEFRNVD